MNPVLAARMQKKSTDMQTRFHTQGEDIVIAQSQDCTPIAEWCAEQRAIGNVGSGDMRFAARIPNVMIEAYMNLYKVTLREVMSEPEHFKKMCNDPALASFRVWQGRI